MFLALPFITVAPLRKSTCPTTMSIDFFRFKITDITTALFILSENLDIYSRHYPSSKNLDHIETHYLMFVLMPTTVSYTVDLTSRREMRRGSKHQHHEHHLRDVKITLLA